MAYDLLTAEEITVVAEARDILARFLNRNPIITSWDALIDYCALTVRGPVERFHVLYLDRANRLIEDVRMGVGTVDHVPVYPREIMKRALILDASALILVHNHPSNSPDPSEADVAMTRKIKDGCQVFGITLHDHVIVTASRCVSMRSLHLI